MGTDINGWVEVRKVYEGLKPPYEVSWDGVIKVNSVVGRSYDMFSCLFGVTPYARFTPIAPNRGLPQDISEEASANYLTFEGEVVAETWITWSEIVAMDWEEQALDGRPHEYFLDSNGTLTYAGKSASRSSDVVEEGRTWQEGIRTYKVERIARRDALMPCWKLLFRLMEILAQEYGSDEVRMVVWFDQ